MITFSAVTPGRASCSKETFGDNWCRFVQTRRHSFQPCNSVKLRSGIQSPDLKPGKIIHRWPYPFLILHLTPEGQDETSLHNTDDPEVPLKLSEALCVRCTNRNYQLL